MEARAGPSAGVSVIGAEAPSNYYVLPREDNPNPVVAGVAPPVAKQHKGAGSGKIGDSVRCSAGTNFIPHIITADAGEDIISKIIAFSQQKPRATCILSAHGVISHVTLRQLGSCGGTLTFKGRHKILSLKGSFRPAGNSESESRIGGLSVSLESPDGQILGGGVAGLMVAASPIQVVAGSILPRHQPGKGGGASAVKVDREACFYSESFPLIFE